MVIEGTVARNYTLGRMKLTDRLACEERAWVAYDYWD